MRSDIARIDLRLRRRSMIWFAVGLAAYAYLIVAMYPLVKSDQSLGSLTADNPTVAALLGVSGSLTSPVGWINGNLYTNFLPLMILLVTIGYGASSLAGQSEAGSLGLIATLPISRRSIVQQKALALALLALPLTLVTLACILIGRFYDLSLPIGAVVGTTFAVWLMCVDFGLAALLIGVLSGSRGLAMGLASAIAAASFLISSLAPIVDAVHSIRWMSLFYWAVGSNQLTDGPTVIAWVVLGAVAALLLVASVLLVDRMDIP
ncbi:ABC transporter permease subunit [Cryobacterium psychrophilum]|uniref:ABC transporter permease n=1 Tax=Cryobacterium psychrophilum TaxID=41988 RepID=A0A4Y8KQ27_9MICO|nr:ABC transporter permease subunit [Cryobacterium psychrophilum]TDW29814.1 ABC-2 family transporter [Cryobacterium psychrophilum]TFD76795.1 ABC transporter permease [Cryobacterium psychrophilum]